ncbi:MAG: glucose-6-phosphate isomerase, partial [Pseudanabaena sp.]
LDRIEEFTQKVHAGTIHPPTASKFTDILSIGIGGSALGPQFVAQALAKADVPLKISFIDNSDPDGIDLVLDLLGDRLSTTLVLVISKSGGTPEAANGMKEVEFAFQKAGLDFAKQAIAITGVGSALEKYAIGNGWLDT